MFCLETILLYNDTCNKQVSVISKDVKIKLLRGAILVMNILDLKKAAVCRGVCGLVEISVFNSPNVFYSSLFPFTMECILVKRSQSLSLNLQDQVIVHIIIANMDMIMRNFAN